MFLDNLNRLMNARKINKNSLARESGIPYTTIDGFYKKGYDNVKLSTLTKLANYFGVSLDYLVNGDSCKYSENELQLIAAYRNHPEMQAAINTLLGISARDSVSSAENVYQIKKAARNGSEKTTIADSEDELVQIPYVARSETGERGTIERTQEEIDDFLSKLKPDTSGQY